MSFVLNKEYTLPEYCDDIYVQDGQMFAVVPQVVGCLITEKNLDVIIHFYDYLGWKVLPQIICDNQGLYWLVRDKYNSSCNVFKVGFQVQRNVLLQQESGNWIAYQGGKDLIAIDDFRKIVKGLKDSALPSAFSDQVCQTMLQTKSHPDNFVNSQPCPWYEEEEEQEQEQQK